MKRKTPNLILCAATGLFLATTPLCAKNKAGNQPHDWSGPYIGLYASHVAGNTADNFQGFLFDAPWITYVDPLPLTGNGFRALVLSCFGALALWRFGEL